MCKLLYVSCLVNSNILQHACLSVQFMQQVHNLTVFCVNISIAIKTEGQICHRAMLLLAISTEHLEEVGRYQA